MHKSREESRVDNWSSLAITDWVLAIDFDWCKSEDANSNQ
jgi:hypothetical protein